MIRVIRLGIVLFGMSLLSALSQETMAAAPQYSESFSKAYAAAVEAFNRNDFEASLARLDEAEKAQPGVSQTLNLRGALFVRMKKLPEAEAVFKKMTETDAKDSIPLFNLGEVYFLQKNYAEGKKMFQKFLAMPDNSQNALGLYKVFLCDVMLGNGTEVGKSIDSLRPTVSNPFYYFANAAVAFKKGNTEEGRGFVKSAFGIYAGGLNAAFADSFIELGWVTQEEVGQIGAVDAAQLKSLSQDPSQQAGQEGQSFGNTLESMLPGLDGKSDKDKDKK